MKKFRVLVVDDKKTVLDSIRDRINYIFTIGDMNYKIELYCLEVEIIKNNDKYWFSNKTLHELYQVSFKPFNLLLLDFGFVQKGLKTVDEIIRLQNIFPNKTKRELIDEVVLNPSHLVSHCYQEPKYFKRIKKNFIEHNGTLCLYTYIPNQFEEDLTSVDVRKNVTNEHFPKAKIKVIDTRKELFNNHQFDNKHDNEYYPYLIAKFLSNIIQYEICESIIIQTERMRSKYIKIKNNNRLKILSAILVSVFSGVFIPTIIDSIGTGNYAYIVVFTISLALVVSFLAFIIKSLDQKNEIYKN